MTWTLARRGGARFGHAGAGGQGAASRRCWAQTCQAVLAGRSSSETSRSVGPARLGVKALPEPLGLTCRS